MNPVETIRQGWILHSEGGTDDPDLALLEGDLEAIAVLADVISLCARSHAEQRPEMAQDAWTKTARLNRAGTSARPYSSEQ